MLKSCREACLKPLSQAKVLPAREAFASESQAGRDQKWRYVSLEHVCPFYPENSFYPGRHCFCLHAGFILRPARRFWGRRGRLPASKMNKIKASAFWSVSLAWKAGK
ncbi:MAG TPA: hypothetical protein DEA73_07790 [Peptococcaceae bacterium]|nr:hypothetical protein [Peptococcaceae bacterium]